MVKDNSYPVEKKRPGQPVFVPTAKEREAVRQMVMVGTPHTEICKVVRGGIAAKTLRKHFRPEIDCASTIANTKIGGTLFNKAMNGDTAALIWWTKARMHWSEKTEVDHKGNITITKAEENL